MSRHLALAGLFLSLCATTAQAQQPFAANLLPTRSATARLGLERQWYAAVPLAAANDRVISFNVDGGQLFVQTSGGSLHAFDAESGQYQWGISTGASAAVGPPVSVNSTLAFVTNLSTLHAIDRRTGRSVWTAELEDVAATSTGADEDLVMVGLRSGKLVAYNARAIPSDGNFPGRSAGTFAWAWQSSGKLSARPIVSPRVVAFGSQDHRVYVTTKGDQKRDTKPELLYRFLTGGTISANMAFLGNRTLVVPSGDDNLYGADLFSGTNRWTVATGSEVDQEPIVSDKAVFAINASGKVMAIDGLTGTLYWEHETSGERILAVTASRVYVETLEHDLIILDRATGRMIADAVATHQRAGLDLRELPLSFPNYQNDRLYFGSSSGFLVCLREIGRVDPLPLRDPRQPPFGTIPPDGFVSDQELPPGSPAPTPPPASDSSEPALKADEDPAPADDAAPAGDEPAENP